MSSTRAQIGMQIFGEEKQRTHLAILDPHKEVDFALIFGRRERGSLFKPEAMCVDTCLFWPGAGLDRIVRVRAATVEGRAVISDLLGKDSTYLERVLDCLAAQEDTEFARYTTMANGFLILGEEFETSHTLSNIAEKLRVASSLQAAEVAPIL